MSKVWLLVCAACLTTLLVTPGRAQLEDASEPLAEDATEAGTGTVDDSTRWDAVLDRLLGGTESGAPAASPADSPPVTETLASEPPQLASSPKPTPPPPATDVPLVWPPWLPICLSLMGIAGILGGIVGAILDLRQPNPEELGLVPESGEEPPPPRRILLRNVLLGLGAAALTPLFLHVTSSELVPEILQGAAGWPGCLVFFGYCLLAAISARSFIHTLSAQVLRAALQKADEASRRAREAQSLAEAAEERARTAEDTANETQGLITEDDSLTDLVGDEALPPLGVGESAAESSPRTAHDLEFVSADDPQDPNVPVLRAISRAGMLLRSSSAIATELRLPQSEVEQALHALESQRCVARIETTQGIRWRITPRGRRLAASH